MSRSIELKFSDDEEVTVNANCTMQDALMGIFTVMEMVVTREPLENRGNLIDDIIQDIKNLKENFLKDEEK